MSGEQVGIEIKEEGKVVVVAVIGELTLLDAPQLKKTVDDLVAKQKHIFLFDFENLTFLDSSGVGLLLRFHAQFVKLSGKIAFMNFHKSVSNTMQKALPRHIREACYFDNKEDAMKYLTA